MQVVRDMILHCDVVAFRMPAEVLRGAMQGGTWSVRGAVEAVLENLGLGLEGDSDVAVSYVYEKLDGATQETARVVLLGR